MTGARPITDADFPGYAQAVARENFLWGAACLGAPEKICGLEVRPLTAWHLRWLILVKSPFLANRPPEVLCEHPGIAEDILRFMWIICPHYVPGSTERTGRGLWLRSPLLRGLNRLLRYRFDSPKDRFNRQYSALLAQSVDRVVGQISEYIEETFMDADPPDRGAKNYYAFEVAIANELHAAYGLRIDFWNQAGPGPNPILIPLKLIYQFRKCRAMAKHGEVAVSNPSDRLLRASLAKISDDSAKAHRLAQYEADLAAWRPRAWNGERPVGAAPGNEYEGGNAHN